VCFNRLIDENTDFLYRRLRDKDASVKKTCLMTLTFLILAGQVKVKGQLGEMAKCLEDEDRRIADLAKMFFTELSTKDNAIYNGFTDIFSLLSSDKNPLEEDALKRIVKFLMSFIEKVISHNRKLVTDSYRNDTRSNWRRNWLQDFRAVRPRDNGTTCHMRYPCCLTKTRRFRRSLEKDFDMGPV
jgi:condensin complex subunit 1